MQPPPKPGRWFTEAARLAAAEARRLKRERPDDFGVPKLFIVRDGEHGFTWELRRFGGVALQRGPKTFPDATSARADGEEALAALLAAADLPTFTRQARS